MLKTPAWLGRASFLFACTVCLCALEWVATPAACIKSSTCVCASIRVYVQCCSGKEVNPSSGGGCGAPLLQDTSGSKRSVEEEGRWEPSPLHEPSSERAKRERERESERSET